MVGEVEGLGRGQYGLSCSSALPLHVPSTVPFPPRLSAYLFLRAQYSSSPLLCLFVFPLLLPSPPPTTLLLHPSVAFSFHPWGMRIGGAEGRRARAEGGGRSVERGGWRAEGGGRSAERRVWRAEGGGWRAESGGRRPRGGARRTEEEPPSSCSALRPPPSTLACSLRIC